MSRCKSERISLDPIRAVSDHLSERIKLDSQEESMPCYNNAYKPTLQSLNSVKSTKKCPLDLPNKTNEFSNMNSNLISNSNLMFRGMFFMQDEPRHFLAPHISTLPEENDYLQRKHLIASNNTVTATSPITSTNNTVNEVKVTEKPPKTRPHNCEECGKSFLMKHHLATHIRVHTGERPHVCPECGKTFALKHCLSTHLLLHSSERPYKCNECNKTFTLKHHLVSHEKIHTRDRPFECRECGQSFAQKRHLSTHLKFHAGERPFSCQVCGETFSREEHLVMHSRFHGGLQPYLCPDCGAGFLRKFQLVEHERQHGRAPDSCPHCGKEFLQKRTLLLHVRTCGLPMPAPHTSPTPPPNMKICKECGESFSSSEGLALHQRLHIGDNSFISDICSLAASLKHAAGNHSGLTSVQNMKKTFPCPHCNRGFSQKHGVHQHMLRYPNGACKLKPFSCAKCGKSFSQKNHLVLHERQHMEPEQRSELKNRMQHLRNATQNNGQQQQQQQQPQQQMQQPQQQMQQSQGQLQPTHPSNQGLLRHLEMSRHHQNFILPHEPSSPPDPLRQNQLTSRDM